MDTCETCEYWKSIDGERGDCESGKIVDGEDLHSESKKAASDMLVHQDTYNEGSYAHAGKDFGCIHHKAKRVSFGGQLEYTIDSDGTTVKVGNMSLKQLEKAKIEMGELSQSSNDKQEASLARLWVEILENEICERSGT